MSASCRPSRVAREGPEATPLTSRTSRFLTDPICWQSDSELPPSLATLWAGNDLLGSKPLWACSRLENRQTGRSGTAHSARWVARLYQKPSLPSHRWVTTGKVLSGLPQGSPSCTQAGQLGARSLHLSIRFRLAKSTGFLRCLSLGPCGRDFNRPYHRPTSPTT